MNFPVIKNTYHFECTRCGNCCSGEQRVNLNPYDLYKMARFKGYNHTRLLFENNLVHLVKEQNKAWLPQIKFKSIASKKHQFCPFLVNEFDEHNRLLGLCSLHPDKKPLICAMAPVGRIIDFKDDSEKFIFVKPAPDCPGVDIPKENRLKELQKRLKAELHFEKEFLKILDKIIVENPPPKYYLDNLYCFPIPIDIEKVFDNALKHLS